MKNETTLRRADIVALLQRLLPVSRKCESHLHRLMDRTGELTLKTYFVRYWQRQAQCGAELENKIYLYGGKPVFEDNPEDAQASAHLDALTDCLNWQTTLVELYDNTLKETLPVDVRLLLQRHEMIYKDVANHLSQLQKPALLAAV
jgi:hypothetical protein